MKIHVQRQFSISIHSLSSFQFKVRWKRLKLLCVLGVRKKNGTMLVMYYHNFSDSWQITSCRTVLNFPYFWFNTRKHNLSHDSTDILKIYVGTMHFQFYCYNDSTFTNNSGCRIFHKKNMISCQVIVKGSVLNCTNYMYYISYFIEENVHFIHNTPHLYTSLQSLIT